MDQSIDVHMHDHAPKAPRAVWSAVDIFNTLRVFTKEPIRKQEIKLEYMNYRLITAYLLWQVKCDKIMHARWDFDASNARTRRVSFNFDAFTHLGQEEQVRVKCLA